MAKRTIRNAFWRHKTTDGGYRISYFGDEVDLPADEIKRGDREGVFEPTVPAATTAASLEAQLANAESRIRQPDGSKDSDTALLHHDLLTDAKDLPAPEPTMPLVSEPVDPDPAATLQVADPVAALKRPAKAAHSDVWEAYVVAATADSDNPITPEQAKNMTKDELQAAVPAPKDG